MGLQRLADAVDVGLRLVVFGFHGGHFVGGALEEAEKALFFLLHIEGFELGYNIGENLSHFAQVLGPDGAEDVLGEVRNFFLCAGAVLDNDAGIGQLDFGEEFLHRLFLGGGKNRLRRLGLLHLGRSGGGQGGGCGSRRGGGRLFDSFI